jgi:hypothetical protein
MKGLQQLSLFGVTAAVAKASSSCSYSDTCSLQGIEGICVDISAGCCAGTSSSGLCPGSADIQCCTLNPCITPQGLGTCQQKESCSGTSLAGYCVGPSDLQCCVDDSSDVIFGENPYYYDNWCNHASNSLTYLDDKYCAKKFPTEQDRDFTCPVTFDKQHLSGYQEDQPLSEVHVDSTLLPTLLSVEANVCVILTRRSEGNSYHKYFCNGEDSLTPYETWSSSKIFAMANAASSLRTEETCIPAVFGLDASTTGRLITATE